MGWNNKSYNQRQRDDIIESILFDMEEKVLIQFSFSLPLLLCLGINTMRGVDGVNH